MKNIVKTTAVFFLFILFASAANAQKAPAKPAADINKPKTDNDVTKQVLVKAADEIKPEDVQKKAAVEVKKITSTEYKPKALPETVVPGSTNIKIPSEELNPQSNPEPKPSPKVHKEGN